MKIFLYLSLLLFPLSASSQQSNFPVIINDSLVFNNSDLIKIYDPAQFYYKPVQYLGEAKDSLKIKFKEFESTNAILKSNYRNDIEIWNKFITGRKLQGIEIIVDVKQTTPLVSISSDLSSFSEDEIAEINKKYDVFLDKLNLGIAVLKDDDPTTKIPQITNLYDAFPVTIINSGNTEMPIGFGNNVPLELEFLDKNNCWITLYGLRRYTCGTGIKLFVLKKDEIAVLFEPRLNGNIKGKFRYRLANIVSNTFYGSINEKYLPKEDPILLSKN